MKITWPYIAGFTDGEGSVGLVTNHKYGMSPRVQLAQAFERGKTLLLEIKQFLEEEGLQKVCIYESNSSKLSDNTCYRLVIGNRADVTKFIEGLLPYLRIKKLEAQDVLRMLRLFPSLPKGGKLAWEGRVRKAAS